MTLLIFSGTLRISSRIRRILIEFLKKPSWFLQISGGITANHGDSQQTPRILWGILCTMQILCTTNSILEESNQSMIFSVILNILNGTRGFLADVKNSLWDPKDAQRDPMEVHQNLNSSNRYLENSMQHPGDFENVQPNLQDTDSSRAFGISYGILIIFSGILWISGQTLEVHKNPNSFN